MTDNPVQIIVAAFNTPDGANTVMNDLKQGRKEGIIGILDAAVVVKDTNGKLKITDAKRRTRKGLMTGGLVGGVLGLLLSPPAAVVAVGGGVIGGLVGQLRSVPMKAEMKDIGSALTPGSSAIVAVIEHVWVTQVEAILAAEGAQIIRDSIKADIAEQLNAGGNVLYSVSSDTTSAEAVRIATTEEAIQISSLVADDQGILLDESYITTVSDADQDSEPDLEP
jgi:uncharacterized membrane protein